MSGAVTGSHTTVRATPYAWPYHGTLTGTRVALVACCDRSWRPARAQSETADRALAEIAAGVRRAGGIVVVLAATPARRGAVHSDSTAAGAPTHDAPLPIPAPDAILSAAGINGFHGSDLDGLLRAHHSSDLIIAGWGLEGPVHSTLRAANDRGYECLLVSDASLATDPELASSALDMVRHSGGIFGAFTTTDAVLEQLALLTTLDGAERTAPHDHLDLEAR